MTRRESSRLNRLWGNGIYFDERPDGSWVARRRGTGHRCKHVKARLARKILRRRIPWALGHVFAEMTRAQRGLDAFKQDARAWCETEGRRLLARPKLLEGLLNESP